jgi:hypothetical protein
MEILLKLDMPDHIAEQIQNDPTIKARLEEWIEAKYITEATHTELVKNLLNASQKSSTEACSQC